MKVCNILKVGIVCCIAVMPLFGQVSPNCFLEDYYPKYTSAPIFSDTSKTTTPFTVTVTVNGADTLGKVSNYVFGNAAAVWVNQNVNNPTLVNYLKTLSPTLIRFPGGSWSNIYFWNSLPSDVPDSVFDCNTYGAAANTKPKVKFGPQVGTWYSLTPASYYDLRDQIGAQGLITVNYGYARYGLGANPVAQAAHLAADWVRYDAGRTEFWEIGNENPGQWEAGWMIDTATNKDGQPQIINGSTYGKHFKVFVDSMKAAAAEIGTTIYIGGIIDHFDASTRSEPDKSWNQQFFSEVGDSADFYVMHNYFGNSSIDTRNQINGAQRDIVANINFIRGDIAAKGAHPKPVAVTEWNCGGPDAAKTSIANGMQAVVLFSEMLKNNFGMSCRWLIANWDADGMFYYNSTPVYPLWNPRPDFYYTYYLQRVTGDHMINATVAGNSDILPYASRFTSGHTGVVIVNKGTTASTIKIDPKSIGVGARYYVYSLSGIDNTTWPQSVVINGRGPNPSTAWGPLSNLAALPAYRYAIGDTITVDSPARTVQFVLIDNGSRTLTGVEERNTQLVHEFKLNQNYPNPFNPSTVISYSLPKDGMVSLKVFDIVGREVAVLIQNQTVAAGVHTVVFDASQLPSGVYFYRLASGQFTETKKMLLIR
ncbi:MAG: T9SS type A sorting domain-containing protein [Bacteroidota bacterium]